MQRSRPISVNSAMTDFAIVFNWSMIVT